MNFEYLVSRLHRDRRFRIAAHLLFWITALLLNWYTSLISFNVYRHFGDRFIWQIAMANTLNLAISYYPLIYLAIPLCRSRRYISGIIVIAILLMMYGLGGALTESTILLNCEVCMASLKVSNPDYYHFLYAALFNRFMAKVFSMGTLIGLIFSLSLPVAIKIALESLRQQIAAIKLAKENVELEFNFLKSQVNPHFLFNSLNNIYGLILKKETGVAAETVARLAEFMRYTLHSPETGRIPIQKELTLLRDYVELEKIRLNYTSVNFTVNAENNNYSLPSLLLVPLIENAFKYSADQPGAVIDISLSIRRDTLQVDVCNTIDVNRQLKNTGGIGLKNLTKRLELYYAGNYSYYSSDNGEKYITKLVINL